MNWWINMPYRPRVVLLVGIAAVLAVALLASCAELPTAEVVKFAPCPVEMPAKPKERLKGAEVTGLPYSAKLDLTLADHADQLAYARALEARLAACTKVPE